MQNLQLLTKKNVLFVTAFYTLPTVFISTEFTMQKFVSWTALVLAAISLYLHVQTTSPALVESDLAAEPPKVDSLSASAAPTEPAVASSITTSSNLTPDVLSYIRNLEQRVKELEQILVFQKHAPSDLKEQIAAILDEREQQESAQRREENPIYGFYEDLPEDYEFKMKTDREFAEQVSNELRQKVLNEALTPEERLAAIGQLQMNMYLLNRQELEQLNYDVVDSVFRMTSRMDDQKLRTSALEMLAHIPVKDIRIAHSFKTLLEKDPNDYLRSVAADGLMAQYYQTRGSDSAEHKQLASEILALYQNGNDKVIHNLLGLHFKDEDQLNDLKRAAGIQ